MSFGTKLKLKPPQTMSYTARETDGHRAVRYDNLKWSLTVI